MSSDRFSMKSQSALATCLICSPSHLLLAPCVEMHIFLSLCAGYIICTRFPIGIRGSWWVLWSLQGISPSLALPADSAMIEGEETFKFNLKSKSCVLTTSKREYLPKVFTAEWGSTNFLGQNVRGQLQKLVTIWFCTQISIHFYAFSNSHPISTSYIWR